MLLRMRCKCIPPAIVASAFKSRAATTLANRYVRIEGSRIEPNGSYPTPGDGHEFKMNIFGLLFSTQDINDLQDCVWNEASFLPTVPAKPLPAASPLSDLSDIGAAMAVTLGDGVTPGLLTNNQLRGTIKERLGDIHFTSTMDLLQAFKREADPAQKHELGQQISDLAFWCQWLIRGSLFEGKLHWELFCQDAIRAPLSKIAFAANAALGRHQIEFVYDDYTLKAAQFPSGFDIDAIDYDVPAAILDAVARISTPVGFNDMAGGQPEHNFRHNHSLMEWQMHGAIAGAEKVFAGDPAGWNGIVQAAKRANRVFHTMLAGTPPATYPQIRLPIKGVRGACGSVYHKHGVFYEGVGADEYHEKKQGMPLTGANSSMYKYFDILVGVTQMRQAFATDPIMMSKMAPPKHMRMLVDTAEKVERSGLLDNPDPAVVLQRLRLAYWVADHRMTHGKYVLKSIYQTEPVGGQSRAEGTGGSTPPFLKLFLDQTIEQLSDAELDEVRHYASKFDTFESGMTKVRQKGQRLEHDEKVVNFH
eukprot:gene3281-202_t